MTYLVPQHCTNADSSCIAFVLWAMLYFHSIYQPVILAERELFCIALVPWALLHLSHHSSTFKRLP